MDDRNDVRRPTKLRVPISVQLLGASLIVGAVAVSIAYFSLERMHTVSEQRTQTVATLARRATLAALIKEDLAAVLRAEQEMMLADTEGEFNYYADIVDRQSSSLEERRKLLAPLLEDQDRQRLDAFGVEWRTWQMNHQMVQDFARLQLAPEATKAALADADEAFARLQKALTGITTSSQAAFRAAIDAEDSAEAGLISEKLRLIERVLRDMADVQRVSLQTQLAEQRGQLEPPEPAVETLSDDIQSQLDRLHELVSDEEAVALDEARAAIKDYWKAQDSLDAAVSEKGGMVAHHFSRDIGRPLGEAAAAALDAIVVGNEQDIEAHRLESHRIYLADRNALIAFTIVGVAASTLASLLTGHGIARRLQRLTDYATRIEKSGDLSLPVPLVHAGDEVGQLATAFDRMRSSLHQKTSELATINEALTHKNREMEQFVYTVSHDLKSPLVSLKGLLALLREDIAAGDEESVTLSMDGLEGSADQLGQIIDDLLTLSRIGSKPLDWADIDVAALVTSLLDDMMPRIDEAGARIELAELPHVMADRSDFTRAIENLLVNALKYGCRSPEPTIVIGGLRTETDVRFYVRDNGPGIDPKYHEKIFGLFQRLDTQTEGTGLGLASVLKVMRLHGGLTWVESAPGEGATFWIAFPDRRGLGNGLKDRSTDALRSV